MEIIEGSKIRCINDKGQRILKNGQSYTILKKDGHRVYIEEHRRFSFLLTRFDIEGTL